MADITMCTYQECALSETCYRFNAKENPYSQSYLVEPKKDCVEKRYELYEEK